MELAKPSAQPACKTSALECHLGSGSAGEEHDFYIHFHSVSPFSRAQPGVLEGVRAGQALLCVSVPSWGSSGPKLPGKIAPSFPVTALPKSRGERLSQAVFCSQSHFACTEAVLLFPFQNVLIGACGEQNLGLSSVSPDLGLKLKVCVQCHPRQSL